MNSTPYQELENHCPDCSYGQPDGTDDYIHECECPAMWVEFVKQNGERPDDVLGADWENLIDAYQFAGMTPPNGETMQSEEESMQTGNKKEEKMTPNSEALENKLAQIKELL